MYLRWLDYTYIWSYLYLYICTTSPWAPRQGSTLELDELTSTEWIRVFADRYLLTNVSLACWNFSGSIHKIALLTSIIYMCIYIIIYTYIYIYTRIHLYRQTYIFIVCIYIYTDLYSILVLRIHMLRYFAPIGSLDIKFCVVRYGTYVSRSVPDALVTAMRKPSSFMEYHGISWNASYVIRVKSRRLCCVMLPRVTTESLLFDASRFAFGGIALLLALLVANGLNPRKGRLIDFDWLAWCHG